MAKLLNPKQQLQHSIRTARESVSLITASFAQPWLYNPSASVRAVLGVWARDSVRHLAATKVLAESGELVLVADCHYRQMFEIWLQVRHLLTFSGAARDEMAETVSASGCLDWLEKLKPVKDQPVVQPGYQDMLAQLALYDPKLIARLKQKRTNRQWNWFGSSYTALARGVSDHYQDLASAYQIISAGTHGSWAVTLGVAQPGPGKLDFKDYIDDDTLDLRASQAVDLTAKLGVAIWNDIAQGVGAPVVALSNS